MGRPSKWPEWKVKKPFVGIEYSLIDSPVWQEISNSAKVLYLQVVRQWDKRNGNKCPYYIPFGYKDVKHLMSKPTYMAARKELLRCGLLVQVELASNNHKGVYSLTRVWDAPEAAIYQ